jgi:hypothetical protein
MENRKWKKTARGKRNEVLKRRIQNVEGTEIKRKKVGRKRKLI